MHVERPSEADATLGQEWREVCEWLKNNSEPLLAEAYRTKDLESVLTVLDLAWTLYLDTLHSLSVRQGGIGPSTIVALDKQSKSYVSLTQPHLRAHRAILKGLEAFLRFKHDEDLSAFPMTDWQYLRRFAGKLCVGGLSYHVQLRRHSRKGVACPGNVEPGKRIRLQSEPLEIDD